MRYLPKTWTISLRGPRARRVPSRPGQEGSACSDAGERGVSGLGRARPAPLSPDCLSRGLREGTPRVTQVTFVIAFHIPRVVVVVIDRGRLRGGQNKTVCGLRNGSSGPCCTNNFGWEFSCGLRLGQKIFDFGVWPKLALQLGGSISHTLCRANRVSCLPLYPGLVPPNPQRPFNSVLQEYTFSSRIAPTP